MIKYDNELKIKSLNTWGVNTEDLDIDRISHVPMHEYRVATEEQPMLYIDNLQCCIGLYAYGNDFGFAAHINPAVMQGDEYELDDKGTAIRCKRIDDLRNAILSNNYFDEPIKFGISIGSRPLDRNHPTVRMIYDGVNNLILLLNLIGIKAEPLEEQYTSEFILDAENNDIILANSSEKRRGR